MTAEESMSTVGRNIQEKATVIWNVANSLFGAYKPHEYGLVILPMTVIKRFHDCLLPTHDAVLKKYEEIKHLAVRDGEVVGFGTLALLLVDGQEKMYGTMKAFNESVALPTKIGDIGIKPEDLDRVLPRVLEMHDIDRSPYPITLPMLQEAFRRLQ